MTLSLFDEEREADNFSQKRAKLYSNQIQRATLIQFASKNSINFFIILGIPYSFLVIDPSEWPSNTGYKKSYDIVSKLLVLNDIAERAVALFCEYKML